MLSMDGTQLRFDANKYTDAELRDLFSLSLDYNDKDVDRSYQKMCQAKAASQPEVLVFLKQARSRLAKSESDTSWASQKTSLMPGSEHPVITNPNYRAGLDSTPSGGSLAHSGQANPGWLNPMNVKTITQTINIDSRFRDITKHPSPLSFSLELPVEQSKVIAMRVAYVSSSAPIHPTDNNKYLFLEIKDGCQNTHSPFVAVSDVGSLSPDIITRVDNPSTTSIGLESVDFENYLEHQREYFGPVTIRKLDLSLLDFRGQALGSLTDTNPNDLWWSVVIIFTKLYD